MAADGPRDLIGSLRLAAEHPMAMDAKSPACRQLCEGGSLHQPGPAKASRKPRYSAAFRLFSPSDERFNA
jgi:hypothetical protein